jgi:hypothetical protein
MKNGKKQNSQKSIVYEFGINKPRGRPRNRWQDEVEDGRIVGGQVRQEKVHNREECKLLLRTARNCPILHIPIEGRNVPILWQLSKAAK